MAMRVRLRAPDEDPDGLAAATAATASATAWPSAHHRELHALDTAPTRRLPPLDVRSPEYIEERLENLKRKPSWRSWLDQYVLDHPETDSEDEGGGESRGHSQRVEIDRAAKPKRAAAPGFVKTTLWSVLIVAFSPLLLLLYPCLRNRGDWPLGCSSLPGLLLHATSTLVFIAFGAVLVYWTICRELPELHASVWRTNLEVRLGELLQSAEVCRASTLQWDRALFQELCMPVTIDAALLLLNVWLLFQSHRKWVRYALVLMAALFVVDVPAKLYQATYPAPDIVQIDPSYALVDEELLIALEGKNLKPGGSVAWVAYWGCVSTASVDSCEKQFQSTFDVGVVSATFSAIDHFIPCYRDPPNPLKVQEFKCFEHIRLRVKDKQSIPGWSKQQQLSGSQSGGSGSGGGGDASARQRIETRVHASVKKTEQQRMSAASKSSESQKLQQQQQRKNARVGTVSITYDGEVAQE